MSDDFLSEIKGDKYRTYYPNDYTIVLNDDEGVAGLLLTFDNISPFVIEVGDVENLEWLRDYLTEVIESLEDADEN